MIGGRFDPYRTIRLWRNLYREALTRGFRGLRVTGEMTFLLERGRLKELLGYERLLHRTLEIPITAICTYNQNLLLARGGVEAYIDLLVSHSTAIITGLEQDS